MASRCVTGTARQGEYWYCFVLYSPGGNPNKMCKYMFYLIFILLLVLMIQDLFLTPLWEMFYIVCLHVKQVEPSSEGFMGLHIWEPKMTCQNNLTFPLLLLVLQRSVRLFCSHFTQGGVDPSSIARKVRDPSPHNHTDHTSACVLARHLPLLDTDSYTCRLHSMHFRFSN